MTRRQAPPRPDGPPPISHAELTDAERTATAAGAYYAEQHDLGTPGDEAYLHAVASARQAICFRVLGGLARETPDGAPTPITVGTDDPTLPDGPGSLLASMDWPTLRRRVPDLGDAEQVLLVPFPASDALVAVPVVARRAFDRFRFGDWAVRCGPDSATPVGSPDTLVTMLDREGFFPTPTAAEECRANLGDSAANLALATLARRVLWQGFDGAPRPTDAPDCPAAEASAPFDRLTVSGHPLHPGAKTRRNLSPTDALSFAPEFTDEIPLRFVAVRRDRAREESVGDLTLTDRLYEQFSGLRAAVADAVPDSVGEYAVVVVHPWQFRTVVHDRYADARRAGVVVPVSDYTRPATPLLSLRTVSPHTSGTSGETPPHLKLALNVLTTSSVRTLSPQAAITGPRASALLRSLCERESFRSFGVLQELASTCYHPPDGPHVEGDGYDDVRNLSALVRQRPTTHELVSDDEAVVTAASLLARPPDGEQSVLSAMLDAYASQTGHTERPAAVESFLREYLDAVVPGPLSLLVKYGVGLEAHLQNNYVVFDEGRPTASLMSDFGAVRIHQPRLADREIEPYPGSEVYADDPAVVRGELWNTLVQHHLGELIGRLSETEPVAAGDCWSLVRERCERVFERLAADDSVPESRVRSDRESLFADRIGHMSMTETWFRDEDNYRRTTVQNPLATDGAR
ncbi:IucA/IucC family protein [Halorussus pelagicus]|uniref:IucA/IucC family protein n=1 Tax=Halorussus pelagicus TaxID=2505977 RepID=UPI000FFB4C21|nr:IucA/IucC family protein [Halorussus pelagicus]